MSLCFVMLVIQYKQSNDVNIHVSHVLYCRRCRILQFCVHTILHRIDRLVHSLACHTESVYSVQAAQRLLIFISVLAILSRLHSVRVKLAFWSRNLLKKCKQPGKRTITCCSVGVSCLLQSKAILICTVSAFNKLEDLQIVLKQIVTCQSHWYINSYQVTVIWLSADYSAKVFVI